MIVLKRGWATFLTRRARYEEWKLSRQHWTNDPLLGYRGGGVKRKSLKMIDRRPVLKLQREKPHRLEWVKGRADGCGPKPIREFTTYWQKGRKQGGGNHEGENPLIRKKKRILVEEVDEEGSETNNWGNPREQESLRTMRNNERLKKRGHRGRFLNNKHFRVVIWGGNWTRRRYSTSD